MVYPALLPLMRTPRLSVVDWTDATADLYGFVRFAGRGNLVSSYVPPRFNWPLQTDTLCEQNAVCRSVHRTAKSDYKLRRVWLYGCLAARNNSAPMWRIFMKFDIRVFFKTLSRNSWRITNLMHQFLSICLFISNSLHISSTWCSSSGETKLYQLSFW
jgi:hypothetical protein